MKTISFASDNNARIHPAVLKAITEANHDTAPAYGGDAYTMRAIEKFKEHLGDGIDVHLVFNGTAANVLSLATMTRSFDAVICSDASHIQESECGAPEKFTGSKLLSVPAVEGKLTLAAIESQCGGVGDEHHVQPRVISITQATEFGTVYTSEEVRAIAEFAHARGIFLHVDGARISNAAAHLGEGLRKCTRDAGVDVLSFGGTKNGLMGAEAVVIFNPALAADFKFIRKQSMQLASKMRFMAVQFEALLSDDLWLKNARHANAMAKLLAEEVARIPGAVISRKVQTNAVFAKIPADLVDRLHQKFYFYKWNAEEVRLMTSFDSTEEDIGQFGKGWRELVGGIGV